MKKLKIRLSINRPISVNLLMLLLKVNSMFQEIEKYTNLIPGVFKLLVGAQNGVEKGCFVK